MKINTSFMEGFGIGLLLYSILISFIIGPNIYKRGQIDAISGKIKYKLVEQEDKSIKWERIFE